MILLIITAAIMLLHDLPPLIRKKDSRGLFIYLPLFTAIAVLSVLLVKNPEMKSPLIWVDRFFREMMALGYQ